MGTGYYLTNITELLDAWVDPLHRGNATPAMMTRGQLGHINIDGTPDSPAHTYSRHNPHFIASLEPGIRALVIAFINRFDFVTYSSCEGHTNEQGTQIAHWRSIGFLWRNESEREFLTRELGAVIYEAQKWWQGTARVHLHTSGLDSDGTRVSCIDLVIGPADLPVHTYFQEADLLCQSLIGVLNYPLSMTAPTEPAPGFS